MIRKLNFVLLAALFALSSCVAVVKHTEVKQNEGGMVKPIETPVPVRPAGQKHVVQLRTPKMDVVRIGVIGLGMRGPGAVRRFTHIPGVEIKALGDLHADRVEKTQKILEKEGFPLATGYSGDKDAWKKMCERSDIDLIYIATDWKSHAEMIIYAMEHGKHVAVEVPAAMTLEEIWKIVDTAERTQKHCMMLENCVYDFFELTTLNMFQKGVFGEALYAEGAYIHQLEDFWGAYENDWRMKFNKHNRGDIYATHGMGPACQVLDIHRGDKMNYLVSMDSKAVNIPMYLQKKRGESGADFKNGQLTMTMIRTEKGKTIQIQHDVATPRPYSRLYNVAGTKGYATKYPIQAYALEKGQMDHSVAKNHEDLNAHSFLPKEVKEELMKKYKHQIHIELEETAKKVGGHGGMDFIMDYRLIYCLRNGLPLDMDVYDLAEWSCLGALTRISLENSSAPVAIPDFTRGHWNDVKGFRHAFVK